MTGVHRTESYELPEVKEWSKWSLRGMINARDNGDTSKDLTNEELGRFIRNIITNGVDGRDEPSIDGKVHTAFIANKKVRWELRDFTIGILRGLIQYIARYQDIIVQSTLIYPEVELGKPISADSILKKNVLTIIPRQLIYLQDVQAVVHENNANLVEALLPHISRYAERLNFSPNYNPGPSPIIRRAAATLSGGSGAKNARQSQTTKSNSAGETSTRRTKAKVESDNEETENTEEYDWDDVDQENEVSDDHESDVNEKARRIADEAYVAAYEAAAKVYSGSPGRRYKADKGKGRANASISKHGNIPTHAQMEAELERMFGGSTISGQVSSASQQRKERKNRA